MMRISQCTIELARDVLPSCFRGKRLVGPIVGFAPTAVDGRDGEILASVITESGERQTLARRNSGKVELFFDLAATIDLVRGEAYPGAELSRSIVTRLPFDYTRFPMPVIGLAAGILSTPMRLDSLPSFPSYPLECLADVLFALGEGNLAARPLSWPDGKRYAVILTHDVDTAWVFRNRRWLDGCMAIEEESGMHSAWYTVPLSSGSAVSQRGLREMAERGHEIGVHGLTHDPALADEPQTVLVRKFARAREILGDFISGAPGYRAPWLSRSARMRGALGETGYLYDTSSPTADFQRANPRSNNGCATMFPFQSDGELVLPITLPQDCMRAAVGKSPQEFWDWTYGLIQCIREWGGLAVLSTHLQPHHSANDAMERGYRSVIERVAADATAWTALPRDVAVWAKTRSEVRGVISTV